MPGDARVEARPEQEGPGVRDHAGEDARMQGGRHGLVLQEDLLLPRHVEERPDHPVRQPDRGGRGVLPWGQAHQDHQDPRGGGPREDQEDRGPVVAGRLQPLGHPPGGDRHRARHEDPRRGKGVPEVPDRGHPHRAGHPRRRREEHPLRLQHLRRQGEGGGQERHRPEERGEGPDLRGRAPVQDPEGRSTGRPGASTRSAGSPSASGRRSSRPTTATSTNPTSACTTSGRWPNPSG